MTLPSTLRGSSHISNMFPSILCPKSRERPSQRTHQKDMYPSLVISVAGVGAVEEDEGDIGVDVEGRRRLIH